jgi:hypothetical protein
VVQGVGFAALIPDSSKSSWYFAMFISNIFPKNCSKSVIAIADYCSGAIIGDVHMLVDKCCLSSSGQQILWRFSPIPRHLSLIEKCSFIETSDEVFLCS